MTVAIPVIRMRPPTACARVHARRLWCDGGEHAGSRTMCVACTDTWRGMVSHLCLHKSWHGPKACTMLAYMCLPNMTRPSILDDDAAPCRVPGESVVESTSVHLCARPKSLSAKVGLLSMHDRRAG